MLAVRSGGAQWPCACSGRAGAVAVRSCSARAAAAAEQADTKSQTLQCMLRETVGYIISLKDSAFGNRRGAKTKSGRAAVRQWSFAASATSR